MSDATQPATQTTFAVYVGPPLETLRSMVAAQFHVRDAFLDPYGVPTFQISAEPVKTKFKTLLNELAQQRLVAAIRGSGDTFTIKVFQKPQAKPSRILINLVLFFATLGSVFYAGYIIWGGFANVVAPEASSYLKGAEFAAGLLAIVGLHEFGHKAATRHHKLDATLPYFIPGPPPFVPFGTFGALISLREPPANRDQLFDLGLSGPVVGFIVTVIVGLLWIVSGVPLSDGQVAALAAKGQITSGGWPIQPALLILIENLGSVIRPDAAPGTLIYSQLFFAAQIGALLTFLNMVPAWQLDGGHISRAVFGAAGHRIATIIGIIGFLLTGYLGFAILLLFFISISRRGLTGVEPLDDVSPISTSRKIVYLLSFAILGLTFSGTLFQFF